jgi:hypothetical protein
MFLTAPVPSIVNRLFKAVLLGVLTALLVHRIADLIGSSNLLVNDFVGYWAASRLLSEKQNPYAPVLLVGYWLIGRMNLLSRDEKTI